MDNEINEQLSHLSPQEQRALLAQMLQKRSRKPKVAPLSFAQERFWFLYQLTPDNPTYNIFGALLFNGHLNRAILKQCLNEIVQRHETLRTTFTTQDGRPLQRISPFTIPQLPVIDLQSMPAAKRDSQAQQIINLEAHRPIDLVQGPIMRLLLLQLGTTKHILVITIHHIAADGWSMDVLVRELLTLYEAYSAGQTASPLADLPLQYAEFAVWQRQWLQGDVLQRLLTYWKTHIGNNPLPLQLPLDYPRPPLQTTRGATYSFTLPHPLLQALKKFSRQQGVTLFVTLLAVFKILLYRYTHQEEIWVGSPIAGRHRRETESLIGLFSNTLVLHSHLSGNLYFQDLVAQVHETVLGALEHQELPFEKLVEELQPKRDMSRNPLFQVMFVLQNIPEPVELANNLHITLLEPDRRTAKFDMALSMAETSQGLKGMVEYNTDLFAPQRITRMAGHLQTILQSIVSNPQQRVADLPLLTPAERHQILETWNETQAAYAHGRCIHEQFEAQVRKFPDAIAVVGKANTLTYKALNYYANQLARSLQAQGIGPENLVGVYMERSIEMVIALLGILKAGAAFLPLDPNYPQERLAYMLRDAQPPLVLTQQHLLERARLPAASPETHPPDLSPPSFICIDRDRPLIARQNINNLPATVRPGNLAYVIYTSGSTGQPKGILIEHRGVINLITSFITSYNPTSQDRMLQQTSLCFDVSVSEIFTPLCTGGAIVLLDPNKTLEFEDLISFIADNKVTMLGAVPSLLRQLNHRMGELPHLRLILSGGEALSWEDVDQLVTKAIVTNGYGPTETTVCSAFYRLDESAFREKAAPAEERTSYTPPVVPIGRPIINTKIYLLDPYLRPVPVGVPGELFIGGVGLARGYLNRPALTAAKFIPNPFLSDERSMMNDEREESDSFLLYRTGDLARYRSDGTIEFLGRVDHQVKIRGFRVEPGEVEALLAQHAAVKEAAVLATELDHASGEKQLVAYVVLLQQQEASLINEIRHFLRQQLPVYMIPSTFIMLDALPLMPNGKVDRQALPLPGKTRPEWAEKLVPPRNPIEEILVEIWAEVLEKEQISIYDDFFELGGHSLLATQIVSRIRATLEIDELPLQHIFEYPTLASLAEIVEDILLSKIEAMSEEEVDLLLQQTEEMETVHEL